MLLVTADAAFSRHFPLLVVLLALILLTRASHTSADACATCMNGGKLLMPNNIFGFCRCKCPRSFKGPRCQFVKKKRSSLSPLALGWNSQLLSEQPEAGYGDGDDVQETPVWNNQEDKLFQLLLQNLYKQQHQGQQQIEQMPQDEEIKRR